MISQKSKTSEIKKKKYDFNFMKKTRSTELIHAFAYLLLSMKVRSK